MRWTAAILCFGLGACHGAGGTDGGVDGGADLGPPMAPTSLFDLNVLTPPGATPDGLDFFALPYPNDLRLDADGTPALGRFFRPDPILGGYLDIIDQRA